MIESKNESNKQSKTQFQNGRTNRIGRHLGTSGGLKKTLATAESLGCETVQIFVSNPQGWAEPVPRPDAEAFAEGSRRLGLDPVVVHSKYLINLASPKGESRERSARALAYEMVAAGALGASLVVVHSGSHGGDGEEAGLSRLVDSLDRAREIAAGLAPDSGQVAEPIVENSVGGGTQLCSTFETLGEVSRRAGVRVCVDTAHAFVAGYDLSTPEGARGVAAELREHLGSGVALLHLNDAKNEMGSRRDGHRKILNGQVARDAWAELFAGLPGVPVVMETPYADLEADAKEVLLVKELAGGLPVTPAGV
ncbi:MAG TPA: deoxyribonuclease IV [Rubrobacteraceae bacterium]|nr:deoxyribonuclease IV [Rubrobacteraceae bacterium]